MTWVGEEICMVVVIFAVDATVVFLVVWVAELWMRGENMARAVVMKTLVAALDIVTVLEVSKLNSLDRVDG